MLRVVAEAEAVVEEDATEEGSYIANLFGVSTTLRLGYEEERRTRYCFVAEGGS